MIEIEQFVCPLTKSAQWQQLQSHKDSLDAVKLSELFSLDGDRFKAFSCEFNELLYDFSKNLITAETIQLLVSLAEQAGLRERVDALFSGEELNITERRPALHTALRNVTLPSLEVNGQNIMPAIRAMHDKMRDISERLRAGLWLGSTGKPITAVVNLGVGGSDLGPRAVCEAFKNQASIHIQMHFVSSIDGNQVVDILRKLDPEKTLFIVSSKSFSTADTLINAETAKNWLLDSIGEGRDLSKHFIGISTSPEKMAAFGIAAENQLPQWDWVGGRYSVWSATGLPIAISIGMHAFEQFLEGAREADDHFRNSKLGTNIPVLQALIAIWYNNFFDAPTQAVLPYDHRLHVLPDFLQQLEMESNGKSISLQGKTVSYDTAPIVWGGFGPNSQHAFYQLLHQGTRFVPAEFIAIVENVAVPEKHQSLALSHCLAQSRALMFGQSIASNKDKKEIMKHSYPGNKPSTTILLKRLTPGSLGSLLAFYEHKVFVQSVIWDINPFDQWGVELGKKLAGQLLDHVAITEAQGPSRDDLDSSTSGLLRFADNH